jgi:hypothetical protein
MSLPRPAVAGRGCERSERVRTLATSAEARWSNPGRDVSPVVPAQAGTHSPCRLKEYEARATSSPKGWWLWVPACAGTTPCVLSASRVISTPIRFSNSPFQTATRHRSRAVRGVGVWFPPQRVRGMERRKAQHGCRRPSPCRLRRRLDGERIALRRSTNVARERGPSLRDTQRANPRHSRSCGKHPLRRLKTKGPHFRVGTGAARPDPAGFLRLRPPPRPAANGRAP